jgi:hypothetical protein
MCFRGPNPKPVLVVRPAPQPTTKASISAPIKHASHTYNKCCSVQRCTVRLKAALSCELEDHGLPFFRLLFVIRFCLRFVCVLHVACCLSVRPSLPVPTSTNAALHFPTVATTRTHRQPVFWFPGIITRARQPAISCKPTPVCVIKACQCCYGEAG